jgi:PAS domain S-box-containing protein
MRLHLLVVDGSSSEAEAIVHELRRAGFEPTFRTASDSTAAAALVARAASGTASPTGAGMPIDVLVIGTAGAGAAIEPGTSERLEAARAAIARAADGHAVRTLRESEEHHRAVLERSGVGVWQVGDDGASLYLNPAMCAMLEVEGLAALAGRTPRSFFPDDGIARLEASQGEPRCAEVEILGARGGRRRAIALESSLLGPRGERTLLRVFADVTELRRLQEKSQQAQKLEAIGRLAGGIAHDFNNLLTVVYTCCGLLHLSIPAGDKGLAHVDQIQSAVKRGSALTRQLLAFARQHPVEPTSIDVNDVVTKMTSMLRPVIGDDIELRVNTDRGLRPIHADRGQIEQVLMNLALNARDAMPRGGKLVVSTANVLLDAEAGRNLDVPAGAYVLIAVQDTGFGMDDETRARVFEPFFTTKAGKGTGLGLATAFGIVRESGGAIAVESAPGKGTTFRLWMPITKEVVAEPRNTEHPPVSRRGTETILLVDDEEGVRVPLAEFLRLHGFVVLEARNGLDAMEHARRHRGEIHVLVTDVVMPRMGGKSLADALLTLRPTMRVLFLSGYSESTILRRGHLDSGVVLLQKPFPPEALIARIHELIGAPAHAP